MGDTVLSQIQYDQEMLQQDNVKTGKELLRHLERFLAEVRGARLQTPVPKKILAEYVPCIPAVVTPSRESRGQMDRKAPRIRFKNRT